MTRVDVRRELYEWAYGRAGYTFDEVVLKFPKIEEWMDGTAKPTIKPLERFARSMYVPFGYLFLPNPPVERVPIPDFRTLNGEHVRRPSPNLLDTIYNCQERQTWYREYLRANREEALDFVGSVTLQDSPDNVAQLIRNKLGFSIAARTECNTWEDALRFFVKSAENAGILVMVNGVVVSNNTRKLDVEEFRGFAFADSYAPLVFVNGCDSKSAQMFTLAHELAHIWLGETGLSNASAHPIAGESPRVETWCNQVAAELLVPRTSLGQMLNRDDENLDQTVQRLRRAFKVSGLVILRRLLDVGYLSRGDFDIAWRIEIERLRALAEGRTSGGGDFYNTTITRVSTPFVQALVASTMEGITLYRDAFRMLGVNQTTTFENMGRRAGLSI